MAWIKSFLVGWRQRVVVDGQQPHWATVIGGMPQGSVRGPLLFVLFINDSPDVVASTVKMFYDDTKKAHSQHSQRRGVYYLRKSGSYCIKKLGPFRQTFF